MAVTYGSIDYSFTNSNTRNVTVPSGTAGDVLVMFGAGYDSIGGGLDVLRENSTSDFSTVDESIADNGGGGLTFQGVFAAVTDGSTPSSYNFSIEGTSYGQGHAMVRTSAGQLQTSGGGIYGFADPSGWLYAPAYTVDTDGSLAVMFATAYNHAIPTLSGWTERVSMDGGYLKVWTKAVDAGSYSSQVINNQTDTSTSQIVIIEPVASGGWDGSFVRVAGGSKARVRMPNGNAASLRLASGAQL